FSRRRFSCFRAWATASTCGRMGSRCGMSCPASADLHDHLACPLHMAMTNPVSYGISWRAMPRNLVHVSQYLLTRPGPLANNVFESVAFVKTLPGLAKPDAQLVFQPARKLNPGFPFPIGHGFAASPVALYPKSRGRLTLANADPTAAPLI